MLTIYCCEEIFSEEIVFKRKFICVWLVIFYVQRTFIKILDKMSYINSWLFIRWINWFHFARSKFWNRWYKQWASIFYQRHNCCNVFLLTKERWNERSRKNRKNDNKNNFVKKLDFGDISILRISMIFSLRNKFTFPSLQCLPIVVSFAYTARIKY